MGVFVSANAPCVAYALRVLSDMGVDAHPTGGNRIEIATGDWDMLDVDERELVVDALVNCGGAGTANVPVAEAEIRPLDDDSDGFVAEAVDVPADGTWSPEIAGDGTGEALPPAEGQEGQKIEGGPQPPPRVGRGSGRDAWAEYAEDELGIDVADGMSRNDIIERVEEVQRGR